MLAEWYVSIADLTVHETRLGIGHGGDNGRDAGRAKLHDALVEFKAGTVRCSAKQCWMSSWIGAFALSKGWSVAFGVQVRCVALAAQARSRAARGGVLPARRSDEHELRQPAIAVEN